MLALGMPSESVIHPAETAMRRLSLLIALAGLAACGAVAPAAGDPSFLLGSAVEGTIPGSYVVQLSWPPTRARWRRSTA